MASDTLTSSLLRTLVASKPKSKFLELGTGTGLSTSWILVGMDFESTLISIDIDPVFLNIARDKLGFDNRLNLVITDSGKWIHENSNQKFDYIFADSWHGKYLLLDEVLSMLKTGGLYIIDDMLPQANWPDGHQEKGNRISSIPGGRERFVFNETRLVNRNHYCGEEIKRRATMH